MPIRGLIFDFDGLIVDTETAIFHAWRDIYAEFGEDLALEEYVQCVGSDFGQYNPQTVLEERVGKPIDWEPILPAKDKRIRSELAEQDTRPHFRRFVADSRGQKLKHAVASSSSLDWVGGWLEKLGLAEAFPVIRCRDHVENIKPEPDLFLAAAEGAGIEPSEALVIEDSENGLKAARAAGMACVIVHNPITAGAQFHGAHAVFDGFEDIRIDSLLEAL